jgi:thiaminase/transcriptional activator TenA
MQFSDKLWSRIAPIYRAIIEHPFNRELAAGTLSPDRFAFYIQQDALYLAEYSRVLSVLAGRSSEAAEDFIRFAGNVFAVEQSLHREFFAAFHIDQPEQKQSPSCFAYTNYLTATVFQRSSEEATAAVLPCFWIYREAGRHICHHAVSENPYQKWIDAYAGEDFSRSVDRAIAIANAAAENAPAPLRALMEKAFETASLLEWMFWDSAWRMETWPALPSISH